MINSIPKILRNLFFIIFIIILIAYVIYNSRIFIAGPQINIIEPQNGIGVNDSPLIRVKGTASNIAFIKLNGRNINVDENSYFDEAVMLYPGYNVIKINAKDKFERVVEKQLEVIYNTNENLSNAIKEDYNFENSSTSTSSPTSTNGF